MKKTIMSLISSFLAAFLFIPSLGIGQIPIEKDVKRIVTFLFTHNGVKPGAGTGFFVALEGEKPPIYLVTAKHVLMPDFKNYVQLFCMRLNNKQGGSEIIPIELSGSRAVRVFMNGQDPHIDIAVIPATDIVLLQGLPPTHYELGAFPISSFATKEHFTKGHIKEGDKSFLTGWFRGYYGSTRNYPVVRFGRLSLLTDDKIPWKDQMGDQMLNLYLIEMLSTGGNSGSPVFFRPNVQRDPRTFLLDTPTLLFAGLLKGYFGDGRGQNSGISAVVPAFQLYEILYSEQVKNAGAPTKPLLPPPTQDIERCKAVDKALR